MRKRQPIARATWSIVTVFVFISVVTGLAVYPAIRFYDWHLGWDLQPDAFRLFLLGAAALPAYFIFAMLFMSLMANGCRVLRWRTPANMEMEIEEMSWGICNWARYSICTHLVNLVVGSVFRATPIWNWYLRQNGARLGRHVWVNSTEVADHCLIDLGDNVVIGAGVRLSGHTVERGLVKTAPVTLGRNCTVGVNTLVGIGTVCGESTQIGALSLVPKFSKLEARSTYVGSPVHKIDLGRSHAA